MPRRCGQLYRQVPQSADYVMYWWHRAAQQVAAGNARRFGFITTNSLPQAFNRRVVQQHLEGADGLSLAFAIPNHPWVDASEAAAVRIAMTVGIKGRDRSGRLLEVTHEDADARTANPRSSWRSAPASSTPICASAPT